MAGETPITVIGNLTADPELRFTPNGVPVANFTVASTPRTFDRQTNEWRDGEAMFLNCSVWRQFAENVAESLSKGMRVIVSGNLKARSYEDRNGNRRTSYEIDVIEIGPSLKFAAAKVSRNQSSGGGNWGGNSAGGQLATSGVSTPVTSAGGLVTRNLRRSEFQRRANLDDVNLIGGATVAVAVLIGASLEVAADDDAHSLGQGLSDVLGELAPHRAVEEHGLTVTPLISLSVKGSRG